MQKVDENFTGKPNFKYDQVKRTWLPDMNELAVYCNEEKVGSVNFDLASFINQTVQKNRLKMVPLH